MKTKIKQLAQSPVIGSDLDIENFSKIMELSHEYKDILHESKKIIKKYYLNGKLNQNEESVINNALILVSGEIPINKINSETDLNSMSDEQMLIKKVESLNLSYLEKLFYLIDSFMSGLIKGKLLDSVVLSLDIDKKDISNVYRFQKNKEKKYFSSPIDIPLKRIPKDRGLTYLEKIVLFANKRSNSNIDISSVKILLQEAEIEYKDFLTIHNILFPQNIITEKQTHNIITKDYEDHKTALINETISPETYNTLHSLISEVFLYSSPVYALALHMSNNNINEAQDDDEDDINERFKELSDKYKLEKIITDAEKGFLNIFESTISSTRNDIMNILETQNTGSLFSYNTQTLNSIRQEMLGYRNTIAQKLSELNNTYQQLTQYWIQVQEGVGGDMTKFIKGGALGMMGAALFGPLGVAAAVGASYFSENEAQEKTDAIESRLISNWEQAHDAFYFTQLENYLHLYQALCDKISEQFIQNYQKAHKLAVDLNKEVEFIRYLKSEIDGMLGREEFINMREELKYLKNLFN